MQRLTAMTLGAAFIGFCGLVYDTGYMRPARAACSGPADLANPQSCKPHALVSGIQVFEHQALENRTLEDRALTLALADTAPGLAARSNRPIGNRPIGRRSGRLGRDAS